MAAGNRRVALRTEAEPQGIYLIVYTIEVIVDSEISNS